jgi:hypothetical protein
VKVDYIEFLEEQEGALEIDIYGDPDTYLEQINSFPAKVRHLIALHFCIGEILNGGFLQLFCNSTGIVAPEALIAFDAIGQPKAKALLEVAMAKLGPNYPRNRETRIEIFKDTYLLDGKDPSPFGELDSEFYGFGEYGRDTWEWLDEYASAGTQ